ncbi:MAG: hypothetical protein MK180_16405 [Rhodobacteraceae bacterium]|nr:hypothetical protein [Paracoccaceae bacterium]
MNRMSAIIALDLVGYSRVMSADEHRTIEKVRAVKAQIVDVAIEAAGGHVVKTMGDGLLIEFSSAVAASPRGWKSRTRCSAAKPICPVTNAWCFGWVSMSARSSSMAEISWANT